MKNLLRLILACAAASVASAQLVNVQKTSSTFLVTNVNSITSAATQDFILGTGTFGTAVTLKSATGIGNFSAPIGVNGIYNARGGAASFTSTNKTIGSTTGTLYVNSSDATAIDLGGSIAFGGAVTGDNVPFAYVGGKKENGTGGNFSGYYVVGTTGSGGVISEWFRISSTGLSTFSGNILGSGPTAPTNTVSGSNQFTAGVATSGPIFASGNISVNSTTSYFLADGRFNSASNGAIIWNNGSNRNGGFAEVATDNWSLGFWNGAATAAPITQVITWDNNKLTTAAGNLTVSGTLTSIVHLDGTGTAPVGAAGAGAGGSPSSVTFDANATDLSGIVSITSGTLPTAAAVVMTVTFNTAYATAPHVELYPANAATALLSGVTMVYVTSATGNFVINAGATGLTAATGYSWVYHVIQ